VSGRITSRVFIRRKLMPPRFSRIAVILCLGLGCVLLAPLSANAQTKEDAKLRNWGRWGSDDERGAANFITPERIAAAAKLIKRGKTFSLAIPLDEKGPVYPGRLNPHRTMVISGADYTAGFEAEFKYADDYIYMPLQGSTQWDSLAHVWYGKTLYNGYPESAIRGAPIAGGATRLGIENVKDSLVGRGVLIDIVAYKGGKLSTGYVITRADIEGALEKQKTEVRAGDIVLIRTGYVPGFYELKEPSAKFRYLNGPQAGIGIDVVPWIHEKRIAAMAADNLGLEALPNEGESVHGAMLKDLGVYMGEIWWLEELAADCATDGRYEFFLAAQPLHIPGAVGSPLNPVAIK
jgi:kynurenine formamidase